MKLLKRPLFRPAPKPKPKPQVRKLNASVSRAASRAELEDYADYDEEDTREPNMRLTHAFIVVLILHVIAVGGVFGFNAMKSRQAAAAKAALTTASAAPAVAEKTAPVEPVEATPAPAPVVAAPVAPTPVAPAPIAKQEVKDIIPAPTAPSSKTTTTSAAVAAPVAANGTTHQVVAGDTLSRIATRYHTSIEALEKANTLAPGTVLRVGQVLQLPAAAAKATAPVAAVAVAGKTTAPAAPVTPVAAKAPEVVKAAPVAPAPAATETVQESGEIYTLAKGDNPYSIAKKFKVSFNELMKVNNITDPTKLQIGQKLKIPAKQ